MRVSGSADTEGRSAIAAADESNRSAVTKVAISFEVFLLLPMFIEFTFLSPISL
jgi:hypothetical protein